MNAAVCWAITLKRDIEKDIDCYQDNDDTCVRCGKKSNNIKDIGDAYCTECNDYLNWKMYLSPKEWLNERKNKIRQKR
jgi:hypothetical protein